MNPEIEMKKPIRIAIITVVAGGILLAIVNQFLLAHSYLYACWRVTHPFGPDVQAFARVVNKTEPVHIPCLIVKIDGPNGWWIESMFKAWFPEAQPPETEKQVYWNQWWKDRHQENESTLILHHDPKF